MAKDPYGELNGLQLDIRNLAGSINTEFLGNFKRLNEEGKVKEVMEGHAGRWAGVRGRLNDLMQAIRKANSKELLNELRAEKKLMVRVHELLTSGFPDEGDREDLSAYLQSLITGSTQHILELVKALISQ